MAQDTYTFSNLTFTEAMAIRIALRGAICQAETGREVARLEALWNRLITQMNEQANMPAPDMVVEDSGPVRYCYGCGTEHPAHAECEADECGEDTANVRAFPNGFMRRRQA